MIITSLREKCPNTELFLVCVFLYSDWIRRFTELFLVKFELNQWKNADIVIDWFKQIKNKHLYKFPTFDIKEFYPSIKACLSKNAINFAKQHTEISGKDKAIIFHARKSLLFNGQQVWIEKQGGLFDVIMGAFDGAEVREAVGNILLYQLSKNYNKKDVGLYRNDGLAIFKHYWLQSRKNKKDIQKLFNNNHLNISTQCNLKIVHYLDVTFNLFASPTKKSHIYIKNQTTHHLF